MSVHAGSTHAVLDNPAVVIALVAIHGNELRVHMLGRGATLGQTVEKMPDVIQKGLEKLFETWQGRKGKPETEGS